MLKFALILCLWVCWKWKKMFVFCLFVCLFFGSWLDAYSCFSYDPVRNPALVFYWINPKIGYEKLHKVINFTAWFTQLLGGPPLSLSPSFSSKRWYSSYAHIGLYTKSPTQETSSSKLSKTPSTPGVALNLLLQTILQFYRLPPPPVSNSFACSLAPSPCTPAAVLY